MIENVFNVKSVKE